MEGMSTWTVVLLTYIYIKSHKTLINNIPYKAITSVLRGYTEYVIWDEQGNYDRDSSKNFVSLNFEFLLFWIIMIWFLMVQKGEFWKTKEEEKKMK
jgi:hypothetical protein